MTLEINRTRFVVIGAVSMLDLLASINQLAHPLSRCIYFGKNEGDYTSHPEVETIAKAQYIAIFDYAPVQAYLIENMQIVMNTDNDQGLDDDTQGKGIVMSA